MAKKLEKKLPKEGLKVAPFVTEEIEYMNAIVEDRHTIAHAGIPMDEHYNIIEEMVDVRKNGKTNID